MSLTFDNALQKIVMQLKVPLKEHKAFLCDATYLAGWINKALKERRSMLAGSFSNLPATGKDCSACPVSIYIVAKSLQPPIYAGII